MNIKFLSLLTILLVFVSAISNADELLHERLQHFPNKQYKSGVDNEVMFNQVRSIFLQSKSNSLKHDDWDYLILTSEIQKYRGKRLRFSAYVKTENVQEKAGLWFRINSKWNRFSHHITSTRKIHPSTLAFENMYDRPIIGTTDWTKYSIVLDVGQKADNTAFGLILRGSGKVWINDCKVEIVGKDIPVTATYQKVTTDSDKNK